MGGGAWTEIDVSILESPRTPARVDAVAMVSRAPSSISSSLDSRTVMVSKQRSC